MTPTSLSQIRNFEQVSLKKKRKYCYLNEFPVSRDAFLKLKNSKKTNHQRQAKIVEIANYFVQKGKGLCYTQNETWIELLKKEGFKCCSSTIDKDLAKLREMNLIHTNSWNRPRHARGGWIRHIITPWNLEQYEKNYIEAVNKKGKGKPDKTKKAFYAYKEKIMQLNFPATHNVPNFPAPKKITRRSDRMNTPYINIPPIIPPNGDGIAKLSRKRIRKRRRPPKPKKIYEKIDETQLKTHYDMQNALDRMLSQPQFSGREAKLKENFRRAYEIAHDRPTQWHKTPLHLAAHATLRGYDLTMQPTNPPTNTDQQYFDLYDHLKWGDQTYCVEPLDKHLERKARMLAQDLASVHGDKLQQLGYTIGKYDMRKIDLQSECTIKYNSPYLFADMLQGCVDRGWNDVVEYAKSKLWNKTN